MTMRLVLSLSFALPLAAVAQAQPATPPDAATIRYVDSASGLTVDEAVRQALAREPGLQDARREVDATNGLRRQAALRPNPTVSFTQQNEPAGSDNDTRVELEWPLDLFRKSSRLAAADREGDVVRYRLSNRERLLAADVRRQYGELAAAAQQLATSAAIVETARRQLELSEAAVNAGATPPLERDVLRVELRRLEAERERDAGRTEITAIELKRLLGLKPTATLQIRHTLEQLVRLDQSSLARTETSRADVQEAAAEVALADARVARAQRDGRFDISLFGMYMRTDAGFAQRGIGPTGTLEPIRGVFHYAGVGAAVTLPLMNRNQGDVAVARAQRSGATARLDARRLAAEAEVAAASSRAEHARRALAAYDADSRELARRNLEVVTETHRLGRATVFDVLAERRRYLDFERGYAAALRETYDAGIAWRQATGDTQ